jgi:NADH:ubiquinone oxidoreductase subunit 6 (subunit J)
MSDLLFIEPEPPRRSQAAIWSFVLSISGVVVVLMAASEQDIGLATVGVGAMATAFFLGLAAICRDGRASRRVGLACWGIAIVVGAVLFGLIAPAGPSPRSAAAARRAQSINNLKQIGLALLNYETSEGRFPPAVVYSPDGRPLYSWRVLILPYIEEKPLYDAFNLSEPWYSPNNRELLARRPSVFNPVTYEADRTVTHAQVFNGPGAAFDDRRGEPLEGFTDPRDQTILVVEASEPVAWSRPIDLPFSQVTQIPPLGRVFKDGNRSDARKVPDQFLALFADGSVRTLKRSMPEAELRALITRNGGELIVHEEFP